MHSRFLLSHDAGRGLSSFRTFSMMVYILYRSLVKIRNCWK